MPLFDLIKDPERAEALAVLVNSAQEELSETLPDGPSEVELLRAAARDADAGARATVAPDFAMDDRAQIFLALCLAKAVQLSQKPYEYDLETEKDFPNQSTLRIVGVVVLVGDWPTVLNSRESALATVGELRRRGYGTPAHDYRRVAGKWVLRIRFSY